MLPLAHLLIQLILAYPLYKIGFLQNYSEVLLFVLTTILIDVDHFLYYLFKGDFKSMIHLFKDAFDKNLPFDKTPIHPFHFLELTLLLFILGFYYHIIMVVFVGIAIHVICDLIEDYRRFKHFELLKLRTLTYQLIQLRKNR